MINRILIRQKVVQVLYSYLLTRNEFKIEPAPRADAPRDARFAYRFYLDLIMLLMELSGQKVGGRLPAVHPAIAADRTLSTSPLLRAIGIDDQVRVAIAPASADMPAFDDALAVIFGEITAGETYRAYSRKRRRTLQDDVEFWISVIDGTVRKNPVLTEAARSLDDFTMAGYDRAFRMLAATIHSYTDNREMFAEARNSLENSLESAYTLYKTLLDLAVSLTQYQERRLDAAKHKYMPTEADLHPDTRFIDNTFIAALERNPDMADFIAKGRKIDWLQDDATMRSLMNAIVESDIYRKYMADPVSSWEGDCNLWRELFRKVILPSDALAYALEENSIYWNDDLEIMGTFLLKTIRQFAVSTDNGADVALLPKYKDEEDAEFGMRLFTDVVDHREEYRAIIDRFINTEQWDSDRLAFMDIVVMMTAIAELLRFPSIPVAVTLNEYIEIANSYSTPRSGHFVNGVLYSVINYLKAEDMLDKPLPAKK